MRRTHLVAWFVWSPKIEPTRTTRRKIKRLSPNALLPSEWNARAYGINRQYSVYLGAHVDTYA